jgi:endonuclease/exonuclease/phosphatase family metal-dependent hydrolase
VTGWRLWLRRLVRVMAVAYPVALLVAVIVLHVFGQIPWVRVALYVPRVLLAIPLPFLVLALALLRDWRFMLSQAVALLMLLFPLMGLVLPWPHFADRDAPVLRVMSWNVMGGGWGWDKVMAQIDELHPDVVMMQEVFTDSRWPVEMLKKRYPEARASTQFIIASRYPIRSVADPPKVPLGDARRSPRSISYVIDTPLGPIAFYNVHPISPRQGMWTLRVGGFRNAIRSGTLFDKDRSQRLDNDGHLLDVQVAVFADNARKETIPVVIGGDTNMTGLTPALGHLSGFDDGFVKAGWGFGYTFPTGRRAWMRLDRIFASPSLRFVGFQVGKHTWASDHMCVVADLQKRKP